MALIRCSSGSGGGTTSLKDYIHDLVRINKTNDFVPYSSRATVTPNSGSGVYVDEVNSIVYFYADFTVNTAPSSSDGYTLYLNTSPVLTDTQMGPFSTNSATSAKWGVTDSSSDNMVEWGIYPYSSSVRALGVRSGQGYANVNSHFIVYGVWSYNPST